MSDLAKIAEQHRRRRAVVYVRQSTPAQLERNHESRARQYALKQRAIELGWPAASVSVVDDDLGRSGASTDGRLGFKELVAFSRARVLSPEAYAGLRIAGFAAVGGGLLIAISGVLRRERELDSPRVAARQKSMATSSVGGRRSRRAPSRRNSKVDAAWGVATVVAVALTVPALIKRENGADARGSRSAAAPSGTRAVTPETPGQPTEESAAEDVVRAHGYEPTNQRAGFVGDSSLKVIVGQTPGSADGGQQQAFFFGPDGQQLGTDVEHPTSRLALAWSEYDTVALTYRLYRPGDAHCCATGGEAPEFRSWRAHARDLGV